MDENRLKANIARNITTYRKRCNLTQAQLAEKISYSDKAISKWERAEGIPDTLVMLQLCEIFNVSLNDMVLDKPKKQSPYFKRNRLLITILSCVIVWLVAVIAFVIGGMIDPDAKIWLAYIYAIPVMFIILVIFSALWGNRVLVFLSVSGLIWTMCLSIYVSLNNFSPVNNDWMVFLIGVPIQLFFAFFFLIKRKQKDV